jgi:hypothetical protein
MKVIFAQNFGQVRRIMTTVPVEVANAFVSFCVNSLGMEVKLEGVYLYDASRVRVSFPADTTPEDLSAAWDIFTN